MPELVAGLAEIALPAEVHGFAVEIEVGPYPAGHHSSHRRAVYAKLTPTTDATARKLKRAGYDRGIILGQAAVDNDTGRALQLPIGDPGRPTVEEQESLARAALAPAARLARLVANAPE